VSHKQKGRPRVRARRYCLCGADLGTASNDMEATAIAKLRVAAHSGPGHGPATATEAMHARGLLAARDLRAERAS